MKRTRIFFLIVILVFSLLLCFFKPLVLFFTTKKIQEVLGAQSLVIGDLVWSPLQSLSFRNIQVEQEDGNHLRVDQIEIQYLLRDLLRCRVSKVVIKDADIAADLSSTIQKFQGRGSFNAGPVGTRLDLDWLELQGIHADLKFREFKLEATLSMRMDFKNRQIPSMNLQVALLNGPDFFMEHAALQISPIPRQSFLTIPLIRYQKIQISDINTAIRQKGRELFLDNLTGHVAHGLIIGSAQLQLDEEFAYEVSLHFSELDIERLVRDFELERKFQMRGFLSGDIKIAGQGSEFEIIDGQLATRPPGGALLIKNEQLLGQIAQYSQQSIDIIVESFENYRYDNGMLTLALDGNNLVMDVLLDGASGKRNLVVVFHDLNPRKEGL